MDTIKPMDWAESHGVKVDFVIKLLREAGVIVRTHLSKVDIKDYEKIIDAVNAEKKKIQEASLTKPIDWAESHGVKVDVVMKLLREAGVIVRTHLSKVDIKDYKKIAVAINAEKRKNSANTSAKQLPQKFSKDWLRQIVKTAEKVQNDNPEQALKSLLKDLKAYIVHL